MSVELAIVGVTLLLYGLELWEFFDEQFEKADNRLARAVAMTPLGHPAEEKRPAKNRKPLTEMVHHEHW